MASILDLIARPMAPDISGAFEQGRAQTRQVNRERLADQEMRAKIDRGNQFRQRAGEAYGAATPDARRQAVSQAAYADPEGAMSLDKQFASQDDQLRKTVGAMATQLMSVPEESHTTRMWMYQQMLPELRRLGIDAPPEYTPEVGQIAKAWAASAQSGQTPAQLQYFNAMTAGLPPDQVEQARRVQMGLEGRASSAGMSMQKITGPDGREYAVVFDPRTGQPRPVSMEELFGGASPMMPAPQGAMVPPPQPPSAQPPGAGPSAPPARPTAPVAGAPFASLTPGEKAAQEAQARANVDLAMKPRIAADTARATAAAEAEMDAQIDFPRVEASATQAIDVIDQLIKHPGLDYITGMYSMAPIIPSTPQAGADALAKQIQGKVFLEAFQMLKGGGQITEIEGAKAEAAMARLQRAQSKGEYVSALSELKSILQSGIERARKKAGGQATGQPRGAGDEVTATGPNGEKIVLRNGQWVPLQ